MGRPKGSKNKPKNQDAGYSRTPTVDPATLPAPLVKRRGRPPGKKPVAPAPVAQPPVTNETPKRRGRPPGSKNRPKDSAAPPPVPQSTTLPAPPTSVEAPKRRGRPPKVVVPVVSVPPVLATAPTVPVVSAQVQITRTECDEGNGETEEAPPAKLVVPYTYEQLNHPALDAFEEHAEAFLDAASAGRKVYFDGKVRPDVSLTRIVLKLLVDYFEINVPEIIARYEAQKAGKA